MAETYILSQTDLKNVADSIRAATGQIEALVWPEGFIPVIPAKPKLNAVTIALSGHILSITNPASNGSFVSKYTVKTGDTVIVETTSTSVDLSEQTLPAGSNVIGVVANGTNFRDSDLSNTVTYGIYTITPTLEHVTGYASNPTTIAQDDTETLYYYSDEQYALPSTLTDFVGADYTWTAEDAYKVVATGVNALIDGLSTYNSVVGISETCILSITTTGSYKVPTTAPTISGATSTYTRHTDNYAVLTLSNLSADVSVTISGE